ncbi:unnamed protein product [Miscanthus lutarioriparius]|uniref:Uncharacterized protein n=1 Tax=Miscanthus lutarioriparius TaxID=422564 RepID=A0A811PE47_9POAL|nr:unnamed protein product [Miscanthus lutarioriparius]
MVEMRAICTNINTWKPLVDNRVSELESTVMDLDERMEQALGTQLPQARPVELSAAAQAGTVTIAQPPPTMTPGDPSASTSMKVPGSAHLEPTLPRVASGSIDHGEGHTHLCAGLGVVYTTAPDPALVTVTEYIEAFSDTVHQLLVHNPHLDPSFITNRFIDGLRDDTKAVVLVQRPHDIDTASSIALLLEEVLTGTSKREFLCMNSSYGKKVSIDGSKSSMQPSPPYTKSTSSNRADTRPPEGSASKTPAEAMVDLKSYRRAKGLCFKCGEKWGPCHKCPKAISLNAVEKIWKLFDDVSDYSPDCPAVDSDSGDDLMHISVQAIRGTRTIRGLDSKNFRYRHMPRCGICRTIRLK